MADQSNEESIADYKEFFTRFANEDGVITTTTLGEVIRSLGENPTEDELKEMIKNFNRGDNEVIDFPAFLAIMNRQLTDKEKEEEIREGFKYFDRENNGFISSTQLRSIIVNAVPNITNEKINQLISEIDPDDEGQVKYEDLITLLLTE